MNLALLARHNWLLAACSVRPTCENKAEFDALFLSRYREWQRMKQTDKETEHN